MVFLPVLHTNIEVLPRYPDLSLLLRILLLGHYRLEDFFFNLAALVAYSQVKNVRHKTYMSGKSSLYYWGVTCQELFQPSNMIFVVSHRLGV
jgi:hypothetical protein